MANLMGFDASQVPEQQEFTALPEGEYTVIATDSEMKPTKAGTGQFLQFTLEVLDGPFKGRKLWDRMNLQNPNQTAVDIARRALGAMCRAVGILKPNDSSELHNKPLVVKVGVELNDKKQQQNVIKAYSPVNGGAPAFAATPAPAAAAAAPWGGQAAAPAPSAAPWGAAATPAAAPWAAK